MLLRLLMGFLGFLRSRQQICHLLRSIDDALNGDAASSWADNDAFKGIANRGDLSVGGRNLEYAVRQVIGVHRIVDQERQPLAFGLRFLQHRKGEGRKGKGAHPAAARVAMKS